jgi:hypothetical protein
MPLLQPLQPVNYLGTDLSGFIWKEEGEWIILYYCLRDFPPTLSKLLAVEWHFTGLFLHFVFGPETSNGLILKQLSGIMGNTEGCALSALIAGYIL